MTVSHALTVDVVLSGSYYAQGCRTITMTFYIDRGNWADGTFLEVFPLLSCWYIDLQNFDTKPGDMSVKETRSISVERNIFVVFRYCH